jgi:hypothetical protein
MLSLPMNTSAELNNSPNQLPYRSILLEERVCVRLWRLSQNFRSPWLSLVGGPC